MFLSSYRSDPFADAREAAGIEPPAVEPPAAEARPSRRPRTVAVAVLTVIAALLFATTSTVSSAPSEIASREGALRSATAARVQADQRVTAATARLAEVRAELEELGLADEALTEDLASARRDLREYAVAAYIDGGQTEIVRASLSPEKAVALSWQSNMAFGTSVSADEAADRFEALREANSPKRLEAAAELDRVTAELEEAEFDAIQAAAHERDAESALARARAAAAKAQADREAAEREQANQRAAAREAQRTVSTAPARARSTSAPAPAPVARTTSSAAGNPTAEESATLARIRRCESGGNYAAVSSSGRYRGAYQFDNATWRGVGGSGDPAAASPAEQDYRALLLLRQRGTRPWPVCGR